MECVLDAISHCGFYVKQGQHRLAAETRPRKSVHVKLGISRSHAWAYHKNRMRRLCSAINLAPDCLGSMVIVPRTSSLQHQGCQTYVHLYSHYKAWLNDIQSKYKRMLTANSHKTSLRVKKATVQKTVDTWISPHWKKEVRHYCTFCTPATSFSSTAGGGMPAHSGEPQHCAAGPCLGHLPLVILRVSVAAHRSHLQGEA